MNIGFPFRLDVRGRTEVVDVDRHVRDLVEQVLFTSPGERVNRPTFGSGVRQLVFRPNSPELAAAVQFTVNGALQQWLSDAIKVEAVDVRAEDSALHVTVTYVALREQERRVASFTSEA